MFGRYQYAASRLGLSPHLHRDAIEICFLERGEQTYRVNDRIYRLRGQDQFFTLPGEVHDTAGLPQERGILYWLILHIGPSRNFLGLADAPAKRLRLELRRLPTRHFQADPDCASLLTQIFDLATREGQPEDGGNQSFRSLRIQALLLQYLALTIQASCRGSRGSVSPLMQRVLADIDRNLAEPVKVPYLATVARLSESRFKARFKSELGIPPAEFWLRKKISRAEQLLKDRSVTEVAHQLGFSSSQYFATVFKRYTLKKPSHYRESTVMLPK